MNITNNMNNIENHDINSGEKITKTMTTTTKTQQETREKKEKVVFWGENPNILFSPNHILEFFPTQNMTFDEKLNAITRIIIVFAIIGFSMTRSIRFLVVFFITMGMIWFIHRHHKMTHENFENNQDDINGVSSFLKPSPIAQKVLETNNALIENVFDEPSDTNPFSNVLISDYEYNVNKKPAPPCFNEKINDVIMKKAKQLIINNNPSQPNITDKLFRDMGDQFMFEQSMHSFHTAPNTTIPNDQNGFAEFCYGGMTSCKEGNMFACAKNLSISQLQ